MWTVLISAYDSQHRPLKMQEYQALNEDTLPALVRRYCEIYPGAETMMVVVKKNPKAKSGLDNVINQG